MNTRRRNTQRERIFWDGNRLSMATQRQFHAAVQEIRGERMMMVPSGANEMAPLVDMADPQGSRESIGREIERANKALMGRYRRNRLLNLEVQRWWLDEWTRPSGLYGVRMLTDDEWERYDALMEAMPVSGFAGVGEREDLTSLVDARMVAETLAIDGELLLTHDPQTMLTRALRPWTRQLAVEGWISEGDVVQEADEVNERWVRHTPEDMLLGGLLCAWPQETDAGPGDVRERLDGLIDRLASAGLERTGSEMKALVERTNDLGGLIGKMDKALPVEMRNAERRSPYLSWRHGGSR